MEDLIISYMFQQLSYQPATNLEGAGWLVGWLVVCFDTGKADDSLRGLRILRCYHRGPDSILGQCGICGR